MFKTAGVRSIRRAFFGLSLVCLAVILGACAHPPTTDSGEPKSWVVENVASKSTAELYADLIAPAVFERSSSKVIDGYTVESGKLRMPDKSEGSLVTVRTANGSLVSLVNKPGKSGLFLVNKQGLSTFSPEPKFDPAVEDGIPSPDEKVATALVNSASEDPKIVDVLLGYSRAAVNRVGGDVMAHALSQIESVNLALRISEVSNVSLRLVGIQVVEQNYPTTTGTLGQLRKIFSAGMAEYVPDIIYGFFDSTPEDTATGWGNIGGRAGIGLARSINTYRHEVGHNAGSIHCNSNGGAKYHYGYNNGKTSTILCGESTGYYSTPALNDEFGLPRGDAVTADTARIWRENAERLSSYAPSRPTAPGNFAKVGSTASTITFSWNASPEAVRYEIYSVEVAYENLPKKIGDSTALTFTATNISGEALYFVKAVSSIGLVSVPSNSVVARP
ncbi:hypothetical protein [Pseudomonas sp. ACN5]|uniref:hypothetical protein n=1 Tax=Pseudomonas sp. ACN5 TaxID=1920427 RepID=UPI000BB3BE01|nr:hypothetical protein [Pseudomonas sp. ACN5]PBJ03955.1 hypothetical protein BSF40_40650 [Pseudomonas sp. ACN5]